MNKLFLGPALLLIIACTDVTLEHDDNYGAGYISVSEALWPTEHAKPYPFTVPYGEISCGSHPNFGRQVYFEPKGFTDESYIGTPLNKSAVDALNQASMRPNVPYSVKEGADLSEAIEVGLMVCDEHQEMLDSNNNL